MKTFTEHMQDCVGATYPLEDIINNLSPEEIEEEVHIYAKEVAQQTIKNVCKNFDEKSVVGQTSIAVISAESNIPEL